MLRALSWHFQQNPGLPAAEKQEHLAAVLYATGVGPDRVFRRLLRRVESLAVLLLVVVACPELGCARGFPGQPWDFSHDTSLATHCAVLGGADTTDGSLMSCDALRTNVEAARDLLIGAGLVADDAAFDREFGDTVISVDPADRCIPGGEGSCTYARVEGSMSEPLTIYLNRYGDQLLHELLHGVQIRANVGNTGDHPHWSDLGYWRLSDEFGGRAFAMVPGVE